MTVTTIPIHSSCPAENAIIEKALSILEGRLQKPEIYISSPDEVKAFLKLKLAEIEHEVFAAVFLDTRHGIIKYEEIFFGTIDGATIYPREVVKAALACNASAVVLVHNHPSGNSEPSLADQTITRRLKEALSLVDIRVLDHFVVGHEITSFAERGML